MKKRIPISNIVEIEDICLEARYHLHINTQEMPKLIFEADLAVGAGGVNTWERCFAHLPTLVISIAENQEYISDECHKAGFIKYIGKSQDIEIIDLSDNITQFIEDVEVRKEIEKSLKNNFKKSGLNDIVELL